MVNLTEKMGNIWNEIKKQPKDVWFFYLFLLTFTLGVRKVILFFPIKRAFNEYTGVYVYASDIFLCSTILVWSISILYNKISNLSISREAIPDVIHRKDIVEKDEFAVKQKLSTDEISFIKAVSRIFNIRWFSWKEQDVPRGTFSEDVEQNNKKLFHVEQFSTIVSIITLYFRAILLGLVFIMLFDHYLWDIWQGQALFWLICGCIVGLGLLSGSKKCSTWNIFDQFCIFFIPLLFIFWSWASLFWSGNVGISFYRSIRFTELYVLFIYIALRFVPYLGQFLCNCSTWNNLGHDNKNVPRGTISADDNLIVSDVSSKNVPRGTFYPPSITLGIIILTGLLQSLVGISQFIAQHSLGIFWLKESLIGPDITGVAKIIINYQPFIRAYGLFPHPNILGGFLFFSIIITLLYKKLFHVEQFGNQNIDNCSTWNNFRDNSLSVEIVPRGTIWLSLKEKVLNMGNIINLILLIQVFGILLSFSKSAILALVIALVYIFVPPRKIQKCSTWNIFELRGRRGTSKIDVSDFKKNSEVEFFNCSTWNNLGIKILKMFHVEHFRVGMSKIALFSGILLMTFVILAYFKFDFETFFLKSLEERNLYLSVSERIISDSPIVGVGTGQFIFEIERILPNLMISQYQPVHNVFLLIWSGWGIVGLVLFIVFLWKLFHACLPEPRRR